MNKVSEHDLRWEIIGGMKDGRNAARGPTADANRQLSHSDQQRADKIFGRVKRFLEKSGVEIQPEDKQHGIVRAEGVG